MSAIFTAFKLPPGVPLDSLNLDFFYNLIVEGRYTPIGPYNVLEQKLLKVPGFVKRRPLVGSLYDQVLRELMDSIFDPVLGKLESNVISYVGEEMQQHFPPSGVEHLPPSDHILLIDYTFLGDPVLAIGMSEYPIHEFKRVLDVLEEFGPFAIEDASSGRWFLTSDIRNLGSGHE